MSEEAKTHHPTPYSAGKQVFPDTEKTHRKTGNDGVERQNQKRRKNYRGISFKKIQTRVQGEGH